jgi:hypothetical protein
MIAVDELTATTGMTYRLQGAVEALDAALGRDSSPRGSLKDSIRMARLGDA